MNFQVLFLNRDSFYDYACWNWNDILKYLFINICINCIKLNKELERVIYKFEHPSLKIENSNI